MCAVSLLALWFTVYGNINKTGKNAGIRVNGGNASGRTLIEKRMWIHPI